MAERRAFALGLVVTMLVPVLATGAAPEVQAAAFDTARYGTAAVSDGTSVFVFGGYDAEEHYRPEVLRYDPATDELELRPTLLPSGRAYASAVWTGSVFYIFGGWDGSQANADILRYDPATDDVVPMNARLPTARFATSAVWTGSVAYVFGGMQELEPPYHDEVVVFDPRTDTARPLHGQITPNRGTYGTAAVWDGRHAWLFGGDACQTKASTGQMSVQSLPIFVVAEALKALQKLPPPPNPRVSYDCAARAAVVRFDPASGRLDPAGALLSPRDGAAAVWSGRHAYVLGGQDDAALVSSVARYTPATGAAVETATRFERPTTDASAAWLDGRGFVFGGRTPSGPTAEVLRYTVAPPAPTGLRAEPTGVRGEVALAWERVYGDDMGPLTGFAVYRDGARVALLGNVTSWTDTGLRDATDFRYEVAQVSDGGEGFPSASALARTVPGVASAPRAVLARSGPEPGEISLSWAPPANDADSPVVGYRVYDAGAGGLVAEVAATAATVRGVPAGEFRTHVVRAVNGVGEGETSAPATARAPVPPAAPPRPAVVAGPGRGEASLSWSAPADDGGTRVLAYRVMRGAPGAEAFVAETSGTTFRDAGLDDGARWSYRVAAVNGVGEGASSLAAEVETYVLPAASPALVAVGGPYGRQVSLDWQPPAHTGGAPLSGWVVKRSDGATLDASGGRLAGFESGDDGFVRTPPSPTNLVARDPATSRLVVQTNRFPPTQSFARPLGPACTEATSFSAEARFAIPVAGDWVEFVPLVVGQSGADPLAGASAYFEYWGRAGWNQGPVVDLVVRDASGAERLRERVPVAIGPAYRASLAYDATARTFTLELFDAAGLSVRQAVVGAPWTFSVSAVGVALHLGDLPWAETSYNRPMTAWVDDVRIRGPCSRGFTDDGLPAATALAYTVAAVNPVGVGPDSAEAVATTFGVPSAPRTPSATAGPRAGEVKVQWSPPATDGGRPVLGYRVLRTLDGPEAQVGQVTGTSFTDAGLPPATAATYRVRAFSDMGEGEATVPVAATTFAGPASPSGFTVTPSGVAGEVALEWDAATAEPPVTSYRVYRAAGGGPQVLAATVPAFPSTKATFDTGLDGFVKTADGPWSDVSWDAAAKRVRLHADRRDNVDEAVVRPLGRSLTPAEDFAFDARMAVTTAGAWQRAWPFFFADGAAPRPGGHPNTLGFTFYGQASTPRLGVYYHDATGALRMSAASYAAVGTVYVTSVDYDASDRRLTLTIRAEGAGTPLVSATRVLPPGETFLFDRSGISVDQEPEWSSAEPPTTMWVDDVTVLQPGERHVHVDRGNRPGDVVAYTVSAVNEVGEGAAVPEVVHVFPAVPPSAPTGLLAETGAGPGDIRLAWTPPADDGGAPVASYVVYRAGPGAPEAPVAEVETPSYLDVGLEDGVQFTYRVSARNVAGEGARSLAASRVATGYAPRAPEGLAVTSPSPGAVDLAWVPPTRLPSAPIVSWDIERAESEGAFAPLANHVPAPLHHTFDTGPDGFVRTADQPWSHVAHDPPAKRVRLYSDRRDHADERFQKPLPLRLDGAQSFVVSAKFAVNDPGEWQRAWPLFLASADAPRAGGHPNTLGFALYDDRATPHVGPYYTDAGGVTRVAASRAVAVGAVHGFHVAYDRHTRALSFELRDAAGGALLSRTYVVGTNPGDGFSFDLVGVSNDHEPEWSSYERPLDAWVDDIVVDVDDGFVHFADAGPKLATRWYRVAAVNAFGRGAWSEAVPVVVRGSAPSEPTLLRATAGPGFGEVALSWAPPLDDGGTLVVRYDVYAGPTSTTATTRVVAGTSDLAWTDRGLGNGTTRWYRVVAVNDLGAGPSSAPIPGRTFAAPGAPRDLVVRGLAYASGVGVEEGHVVLAWSEPADLGGLGGTTYLVRRQAPGEAWTLVGETAALGFVDGPGTGVWTYEVSARNAVGEGPASARVRVLVVAT